MAFNRDRNGGNRGGGFRSRPVFGNRPRFGDRGDRGPVEMHQAVCDNCGKSCEVPFRPTSGKPVYCSSCFENQGGGSDRRFERRGPERSEDRQMFEAVCADCGNTCRVPFQPTGDKPVFCSNCFGEKKNAGGNTGGDREKLEELNSKLDKILSLLEKPVKAAKKPKEEKPIVVDETS